MARFYKGCDDFTFFESCGVADLITTCFGGRNRKCAEAFVTSGKVCKPHQGTAAPKLVAILSPVPPRSHACFPLVCCLLQSWEDIEKEILGGQKLQVSNQGLTQSQSQTLPNFPLLIVCVSLTNQLRAH